MSGEYGRRARISLLAPLAQGCTLETYYRRGIVMGILRWTLMFILFLSYFFLNYAFAKPWINPKDVIGDPMLARLQQGRKKLTDLEKEEIKKYGYTGLELMTYVDVNKEPGQDNDQFHRCVNYIKGQIVVYTALLRMKYYYESYRDKLTYSGIKPGDLEYKLIGFYTDPPKDKGFGILNIYYLESEDKPRDKEEWTILPTLRRVRKGVAANRQEEYARMIVTYDDDEGREPWEEAHRIIGEDVIGGKPCFVVESTHRLIPDYYLSKRITWVEKEKFLDLHEEQFDRQGKLFKIFDKEWYRAPNGNHWVPRQTNVIKLPSRERTVHQTPAWIIDQDLTDEDFSIRVLEKEVIRRNDIPSLPPIKSLSDFPPEPNIRWEFWKKLGQIPEVKK